MTTLSPRPWIGPVLISLALHGTLVAAGRALLLHRSDLMTASSPPSRWEMDLETSVQKPRERAAATTSLPSSKASEGSSAPSKVAPFAPSTSQPSTPAEPASSEFVREAWGKIHRALQYPVALQRRGVQGRVRVELEVAPNGDLTRARVIESSGHAALDGQALQAVRAAAPFTSPRTTDPIRLEVPLEFRVRGR